jgi:hypothetical protein
MLVKPPLATATILKITDIIASITEIIQDQPLPFNNANANTNAPTPNAIDTVETPIVIACIRLVAVLSTLPIVRLPSLLSKSFLHISGPKNIGHIILVYEYR